VQTLSGSTCIAAVELFFDQCLPRRRRSDCIFSLHSAVNFLHHSIENGRHKPGLREHLVYISMFLTDQANLEYSVVEYSSLRSASDDSHCTSPLCLGYRQRLLPSWRMACESLRKHLHPYQMSTKLRSHVSRSSYILVTTTRLNPFGGRRLSKECKA
jgi:hypothetical protein